MTEREWLELLVLSLVAAYHSLPVDADGGLYDDAIVGWGTGRKMKCACHMKTIADLLKPAAEKT